MQDDQSDGDQLSETSDIEPIEDEDEDCDVDMQTVWLRCVAIEKPLS